MKKALYITLTAAVFGVLYIALYHPDQIVEPTVSLKEAAVVSTPASDVNPLTTTPAPIASQPVTPAANPAPVVTNIVAAPPVARTPDPVIANATPPSPTNYQRSDGFENMCVQMPDGSWTTVIFQGTPSGTMYPYNGAIDPSTQAPATATGSQAWCAANIPSHD